MSAVEQQIDPVKLSSGVAVETFGPVTSPSDLIDLEESFDPAFRWAFRGQSQPYGTLVPSFQRIFRQKRSVGAAQIIERDLIKTFRIHYAKLKDRTSEMPLDDSIDKRYDLRCLSVMQHYGVPTRLLDWTSDFWAAVYFACAGEPSKEAELWVYARNIFYTQSLSTSYLASLLQPNRVGSILPPDPDLLSRREDNVIAELDPQITPRMREQSAHHTLSSDVFADHCPMLFDLAQKSGIKASFRRVLIAAGCKEKALRFLEGHKDKTAGTIFPDVEGLGKFLHWHLESLVTTLL